MLLASLCYFLGLSFFWATIISLLLILFWELVEAMIKIIESKKNVLMDIIIGMAGFFFVANMHYVHDYNFSLKIFLTLLFVILFLSLWGFLDFLRRGYR